MLEEEVTMADEGLIEAVREVRDAVNRLLRQLEGQQEGGRKYGCEELLKAADEFNPSGSTYQEQAR
jgi:signal transduction protein with GAF and PtsI domain